MLAAGIFLGRVPPEPLKMTLHQDSGVPEKAGQGHFPGDQSYSQWQGGAEKVESLFRFHAFYCTSFEVPDSQKKKLVNNLQFLCCLLTTVT